MTPYEVPLSLSPQAFTIALSGVPYALTVKWNAPGPCWVLDIAKPDGTLIIGSVPLVTGTDLLAQYAYLGIAGQLVVQSDIDITIVPSWDTLGVSGRLFFLAS